MAAKSAAGGYTFHSIGLGSAAQSKAKMRLGNGPLLTLQQIMEQLGHTGRTIDILKVDCECLLITHAQYSCYAAVQTVLRAVFGDDVAHMIVTAVRSTSLHSSL
jgi:Methyltransferase domain